MAITEVALHGINASVKLADVSANQDISLSYLEQIFLKLKKAGIVIAIKGPGCSYKLKTEPDKIYIINIIDAVEENTKMTRCSVDKNCRKNGVKCKTHDLWKGLGEQIRKYFSGISVADVLAGRIRETIY